MSELPFTPAPENFGSHIEAAPLVSTTEGDFQVDLHKSTLPSAERGRQFAQAARAAIDAQLLKQELSRGPTPEQQLAQVATFGMHLADFRVWELEQGEGEHAHQFRSAAAEFERQATEIDRIAQLENDFAQAAPISNPELRAQEHERESTARGDFEKWAGEFNRNPSDTDMNTGYELTNSRR